MKRTELDRGDKPLTRKQGMRSVSKKRQKGAAERARVRARVFERDGHRCQIAKIEDAGPCFGPLTFHHIEKAGQGGAYSEANGLCACARHNTMVEDRPEWAEANGLCKRRRYPAVPVDALDELVDRRPTQLVRVWRDADGRITRAKPVPMPPMWKRAV